MKYSGFWRKHIDVKAVDAPFNSAPGVITFMIVLYSFLVFAMNNTNLNYMKFQRQL